ncbi:beta-ketoacyl synthase N-terminal-like domain-containing protein [Streptomyces sp. NPDC048441]|uniref:beta-ketoacyl synthase N-terminal-like domain-containing protein n=1 Tax=Streptomyces sp. NPDC048441 TaxID=3365552 RepID=UPI0037244C2D
MTDPPAWLEISGIGVVGAAGRHVGELTDALRTGRTAIAETGAPAPAYGACLADVDLSERLAWLKERGLPHDLARRATKLAARSPLPVRAAVCAALEAWLDADLIRAPHPPDRVGLVVAGHNLTGHHADELRPAFERNPAHLSPRFALHCQDTDHVGTLSALLGLRGEGFTVGGASASGALGIIMAARQIQCGAVDACLVVGALTRLTGMEAGGLVNIGALAGRDGGAPGAPFDVRHRGFVPGEAAAALFLEPVARAHSRTPHALLAGFATRLDGNALADPSQEGEAAVMRGALDAAGITPEHVGYLNAHGTASPRGDATELAAVREVFGPAVGALRINSTKAVTGHCLAAAGVVEAVATAVQLRRGFLHHVPGLERPVDEGLRFVRGGAEQRRVRFALSNSFGFGGINASLLLAAARR